MSRAGTCADNLKPRAFHCNYEVKCLTHWPRNATGPFLFLSLRTWRNNTGYEPWCGTHLSFLGSIIVAAFRPLMTFYPLNINKLPGHTLTHPCTGSDKNKWTSSFLIHCVWWINLKGL
ncbi:hypothetical protein Q8A67_024616 [Cirrhinus molitorella]|uniref:Uncharacterized protein n=1 Tax=Cirrhinus molitorella TaxID=172907 RepID=A0AA88P5X0_9TELE|nr:hypothetical protein Q8A67_024616 [Cirrhinus molitorella]